jgi:hypothetical protein
VVFYADERLCVVLDDDSHFMVVYEEVEKVKSEEDGKQSTYYYLRWTPVR